jgi:phosphohistidine swiveling domain-containing protein
VDSIDVFAGSVGVALPAVVGAEVATAVVPDGALVRIDGGTGEVRVLTGPARA